VKLFFHLFPSLLPFSSLCLFVTFYHNVHVFLTYFFKTSNPMKSEMNHMLAGRCHAGTQLSQVTWLPFYDPYLLVCLFRPVPAGLQSVTFSEWSANSSFYWKNASETANFRASILFLKLYGFYWVYWSFQKDHTA
jgi:hypothetical protein